MDKLYADLKYEILKFVSYFELDHVLPCFRLTPKEVAYIKYKIYKQRLTVTNQYGCITYSVDGKLHKLNGPAVVFESGSKMWAINGKRHREDGPAIEHANGDKEWYLRGERHRSNGPALERADGGKAWYVNGERHRLNGPAMEWADGRQEWYIHDKKVPPKTSCTIL